MDLSRFVSKIDQAIIKIDELLTQHQSSKNLLDRKDLLNTAKEIILGTSNDINQFTDLTKLPMIVHAKSMLMQLMKERVLARKSKTNKKSTNDVRKYAISSDSEAEEEFDDSLYAKIIDDYLNGTDGKASIQKMITKKLENSDERSIRKYAQIFRELEDETSKQIEKMFDTRVGLSKG